MKNMLKDAGILFLITLISGLLLGLVYQVTKDPIAIQEENARQAARSEVFQDADHFEDSEGFTEEAAQAVLNDGGFAQQSINEYAAAMDKDGSILGYVITVTTHEGYGGDIKFTIGVREDGTLNGMSILSISETRGLGMKAEEVLKPQFEGKKADSYAYTKDGASAADEIDAITSATITTNAVTNGANAGLYYFQTELKGGSGNE